MIMNKLILKYIVIFVLVFASSTSCDIFDIYNPSAVTESFYNTKDGQNRLIYAMYSRFRTHYSINEPMYFGTDLYMSVAQSPSEMMFDAYDKSFNSTAPVIGGLWNNLYKIVQEGNTLINRLSPEQDDITEQEYISMKAQGKFLRALAYYYLVETFGPVPLLTEEVEDVIYEVTRDSEDKIYDFIISELEEDVIEKLGFTAMERGKLTNAAAYHFLGKVYLTRAYKSFGSSNDFNLAAANFDKVILDPEERYAMLSSFNDVFEENNQGNKEVIWAIQYTEDKNYNGGGNPLQSMFGIHFQALHPTDFVENQKDYSSMHRAYWINPKTHELFDNKSDSRYTSTFQFEFIANNPKSEKYGEVAIKFPKWNEPNQDSPDPQNGYYPFKDEEGDYYWYPQDSYLPVLSKGSNHMPIVKKFKDTKIDWGAGGSREAVVYRVADTYLLASEAYLGAGDKNLALDRINEVRKRAAISPSEQSNMLLTDIDLDIILDERGRELLGEFDRWYDLKRSGKLIERVMDYNIKAKANGNLSELYLVRPIPQDEINKVKGLEQNNAYK